MDSVGIGLEEFGRHIINVSLVVRDQSVQNLDDGLRLPQ